MPEKLLNDRQVKGSKAKAKPYRLADGGNLYLYVSTSGVKSWQFRYRLNGTPYTYTVGKYPRVSLEAARSEATRARDDVAAGEHLTVKKRAAVLERIASNADTFVQVAGAWMEAEAHRKRWTADYRNEVAASLKNHLRPIEALPITKVNARIVAPILRGMMTRAPLMLDKVHRRLRGIMEFAVEEGLITGNPLPMRRPRVDRRHFPAITDLPGIGEILRAARSADPCKGISRAHLLLAFTAQRVNEVSPAKWDEFDLSAGLWVIPRERMKRKDAERGPHTVPLPKVILSHLCDWRAADGDSSRYVCPAPRDPSMPITAEGVEKFYRRTLNLAGKHSPHSWRSAFSTICREAGKPDDLIESQLDHVVGNKVQAAYDRAKRIDLRRALLEWYEQTLIAARDGAAVLTLPNRGGK